MDDLKGKTLKELEELKQRLEHSIAVMDEMLVSQIETALNVAGDEAKELTSARSLQIRADINSRFAASLNDLQIRLATCQQTINGLTQNGTQSTNSGLEKVESSVPSASHYKALNTGVFSGALAPRVLDERDDVLRAVPIHAHDGKPVKLELRIP